MPTTNNTSQIHLYYQLSTYLQQSGISEGQERENNLNLGGDCVGWSFLFSYYKSINKLQDFNSIKNYISKWDGQLSSLSSNLGMSESLKNKYPTGQKLFEQTINDVVWFSQIKSKKIADISQNDRVEQYEFAADKHHDLKNIFSFLREEHTDISLQELPDMLKIAQLWKNAWLDLGIYGQNKDNQIQGHALSIYIDSDGNLNYFDCNKTTHSDNSSPEEISAQLFKAISNWENITLNDFSLYQFVPKNQSSDSNIKTDSIGTELNINKNVKMKFLDMAIKSHQLDPIYKMLSIEKQQDSELIKLYEKPLFKEAKKIEHPDMLDLLVKHNPELSKNSDECIFDDLSKLFNKLSISELLDFELNDVLFDAPKNTAQPIEFIPMNTIGNNLLDAQLATTPGIDF